MKPQFQRITHTGFYFVGWRVIYLEPGEPYRCRRFRHRWRHMHRSPRTMQERRRNVGEAHDREYRARGRRMVLPSSYDDLVASRTGGKSWKDHTRFRKQWMMNL